DAATPEVRGDDAAHRVRPGGGARVVEKHATVGRFDYHAPAVPDREERDARLVRRSRLKAEGEAEDGPGNDRVEALSRTRPVEQHETRDEHIEADEPPRPRRRRVDVP